MPLIRRSLSSLCFFILLQTKIYEKDHKVFFVIGFKVMLNGRTTERIMLAYGYGLEASQEAVTEYRVLGPTISGCSWLELRPLTNHKHQV